MKSIKSILALFVAVLLMSTTTYAQRPSAPGADRGNKMMEMMTTELGLSDTQVERITTIQEEFTAKMRALRSSGDKTAMRDEMKQLAEKREATISSVLTEEQRTKWAAMKADRGSRPNMGERPARPEGKRPSASNSGKRPSTDGNKRPRGMRDGSNANKMEKALGLSSSKATALKKLSKEHQANIKELKASGKERKIKKVNKKHDKAVKKLLTSEQYEKWSAMKLDKKNVKRDMLK